MKKEELIQLIETGDVDKIIQVLNTQAVVSGIENALKVLDPKKHAIFDQQKRKDKQIKDDSGNVVDTKTVARLPLAIQKKIVNTAVHFLGNPELYADAKSDLEKDFMDIHRKIRKDNNMRFKFRNLAKRVKSEKHAAILWYTVDAPEGHWNTVKFNSKFRFRMKIVSPSSGDELYPAWDEFGDMVAFARKYKVKNVEGEDVEHFDIDTAEKIYYARKATSGWEWSSDGVNYAPGFQQGQVNTIGKIRYIYGAQPVTDTEDVQDLIDALEVIISDHNDTNKYNGNPIIFAEGDVEGFAEKGETGKLLIGKNGAKVSYLTWNNAPESIKMEIENLLKFIYGLTYTPELSLDSLKNLGYFSTVALQTLFMDPHIKAADSEEIFGEMEQRSINYLSAAIVKLDQKYKPALALDIYPVFTYYIPKNILEEVDRIIKSKNAGILSEETAIRQNPSVENADEEIEAIKKDREEDDAREAAKAKSKMIPVNN